MGKIIDRVRQREARKRARAKALDEALDKFPIIPIGMGRDFKPLVRPGGLILAHNFDQAVAYGRAVNANPQLETLVPAGSLAITLKKR